jgi:FAD/FMN-containing dehydrogenase
MGAQQFATDAILIDTTPLSKVLNFNPENGTIEVEAGTRWPQVIGYLLQEQKGEK